MVSRPPLEHETCGWCRESLDRYYRVPATMDFAFCSRRCADEHEKWRASRDGWVRATRRIMNRDS